MSQDVIAEIERIMAEAKNEDIRLKAGVKVAAPRLRKHLLKIAKLCGDGRKTAHERKVALPVRPRGSRATMPQPEVKAESVMQAPAAIVAPAPPTPAAAPPVAALKPAAKPKGRKPAAQATVPV